MSEILKKAREWHHDLRQTLVVADVDEETNDTVRNYADILISLIKQVQESEENIEVSQGALSDASTDVVLLKRENKRLKKALFVSLVHAVESQSDGTVDVITDTLQDLDFMDMWDEDYEKGKRLWEEWRK